MLNSTFLSGRIQIRRGLLFGLLIVTALMAFELFNYSTTDFALSDLLGDLSFLSIRWATILSIAFCGIDFAGIARLFTPEQGADEPHEVWYLFGAWLLAATMNAMLTWWGVSIAILNHETLGNAVVERDTLLKIVPVFVAVMVWLSRVLIIGTISVAGDRLFSQADIRSTRAPNRKSSLTKTRNKKPRTNGKQSSIRPLGNRTSTVRRGVRASKTSSYSSYNPAPKPEPEYESDYDSQEPTYSPVSFNGQRKSRQSQTRF